MPSPILAPYREQIAERLRHGQSKTEIKKWLRETEQVSISNSQYYEYMRQFDGEAASPVEEEPETLLREDRKPEPKPDDAALRTFLVEFPYAVQELSGRLAALERTTREQEKTTLQALQETLASLSQRVQERSEQSALPASGETIMPTAPPSVPVMADMLRQIWKRAFLVSGVVWGVFELLIVRGYWRPLWAAVRRAV